MNDLSSPLWGNFMLNTPQVEASSRFLDVLAFRNQLIASNMANVDTPGYRTLDINFSQELQRGHSEDESDAGGLSYASFSPVVRQVPGLMERPDGNNVSLDRESLLLADVQLRYNTAVQLLRAEFHRISSAIHEGSTSE
jgi:flagellar basal-body rod protein FlgB